MRAACSAQSKPPYAPPTCTMPAVATACATRLPHTCSKPVTTSGRCRSCSATKTCGRRWFTRMCSIAVGAVCAARSTSTENCEAQTHEYAASVQKKRCGVFVCWRKGARDLVMHTLPILISKRWATSSWLRPCAAGPEESFFLHADDGILFGLGVHLKPVGILFRQRRL